MGDHGEGSFGDSLKKAREASGLGIKELADRTKIQPRYLEALESEDWASLPGGVIGRGFVRSIAHEIGLTVDQLLRQYRGARPEEVAHPPRPLPKADWNVEIGAPRRVGPILFGFLFLLGAALGIWIWSPWRLPTRVLTDPIAAVKDDRQLAGGDLPSESAGAVPSDAGRTEREQPAPATPPDPPAQSAQESVSHAPAAPVSAKPAPQESTAPPAALPEARTEQAPAQQTASEPGSGALRLEIQATERAWIRVASDGGQAQERILGPGDRLSFEAQRGFALKLGNAGGVRLFWNGSPLKPPGRPGQVTSISLPENLETLKP